MASARTAHAVVETKDVERYRKLVSKGAPGRHLYALFLGLNVFDVSNVLRALDLGFPYRTFERLQESSGLSFDELGSLVAIPRRTLTRRKREGRFLPLESDRLLRAARLFADALALFEGDQQAATDWLRARQLALGNAVPIELAKTEIGAREVEHLMHRLEHGVFS